MKYFICEITFFDLSLLTTIFMLFKRLKILTINSITIYTEVDGVSYRYNRSCDMSDARKLRAQREGRGCLIKMKALPK